MEASYLPEKNVIEAENLAGTKWIGFSKMFYGRLKVEFLDKTNCIYTSKPDKYPMTYTVASGKIFISDIQEPFELRGNMLFTGNLPVFEKSARPRKSR